MKQSEVILLPKIGVTFLLRIFINSSQHILVESYPNQIPLWSKSWIDRVLFTLEVFRLIQLSYNILIFKWCPAMECASWNQSVYMKLNRSYMCFHHSLQTLVEIFSYKLWHNTDLLWGRKNSDGSGHIVVISTQFYVLNI